MSESPPFAVDIAPVSEGTVRVRVEGELDLSTSPSMGEALLEELNRGRSVVLDLSGITFIDSTGLNTLVAALRSCEANGGSLALGPNLPSQVTRVLEITGLDALLPIASR